MMTLGRRLLVRIGWKHKADRMNRMSVQRPNLFVIAVAILYTYGVVLVVLWDANIMSSMSLLPLILVGVGFSSVLGLIRSRRKKSN